jgi:hypothetical protein
MDSRKRMLLAINPPFSSSARVTFFGVDPIGVRRIATIRRKAMKRSFRFRGVTTAAAMSVILAAVIFPIGAPVSAQSSYNSGSTGADGAFSPTSNQTIQVPASGVYNFTTVNIPSGVTITFTPNATNTPLTMLAQGNVTIAGSIGVNGQAGSAIGPGGIGGPGGYRGGDGGVGIAIQSGTNGDGPGGGIGGSVSGSSAGNGGGGGYLSIGSTPTSAGSGQGGASYGSAALLPLLGGSGGAGGAALGSTVGGGGGGGGGALVIASSGTITFSGGIGATGGSGGSASGGKGGGGSGGAIRLVATTITGSGIFNVTGGQNILSGQSDAGAQGYLRAEAYTYTSFSPGVVGGGSVSLATPNPVNLSGGPSLVIASVAGVNAPAMPNGSLTEAPDIVLPAGQANPVTVNLTAANIPVGTAAVVTVIPTTGASTSVSSTVLAGTTASSTAQASVTLPAGVSVITASITINLSNLADNVFPKWIKGEQVEKVEIAADYGRKSHVTYITQSGKRIPAE